jgi:hypothetical protein
MSRLRSCKEMIGNRWPSGDPVHDKVDLLLILNCYAYFQVDFYFSTFCVIHLFGF